MTELMSVAVAQRRLLEDIAATDSATRGAIVTALIHASLDAQLLSDHRTSIILTDLGQLIAAVEVDQREGVT